MTPSAWKPVAFHTWTHFAADRVQTLDLTETELAEIGFNVLVRLQICHALNQGQMRSAQQTQADHSGQANNTATDTDETE